MLFVLQVSYYSEQDFKNLQVNLDYFQYNKSHTIKFSFS